MTTKPNVFAVSPAQAGEVIAAAAFQSLRAAWVDPFDERPVFARLSAEIRQARVATPVPGFGMVPDTVVSLRLGVPVPGDGTAECAVLTADGRGARYDAWCDCPQSPAGESWVYYERWTAEFVRHGFLCPACRKITQTG